MGREKGMTVQPWVYFPDGVRGEACKTLCTTANLSISEIQRLVHEWRHGSTETVNTITQIKIESEAVVDIHRPKSLKIDPEATASNYKLRNSKIQSEATSQPRRLRSSNWVSLV